MIGMKIEQEVLATSILGGEVAEADSALGMGDDTVRFEYDRDVGQCSFSSEMIESPPPMRRIRAPTEPVPEYRRSARTAPGSGPQDSDMEVRHSRRARREERVERSRSRSRNGSNWDAPFGGQPPMTRNHDQAESPDILPGSPAREDYDWFDSHGQRVRVREI